MSDELLYDVRLVERNIAKGKLNRKDHQKWLKAQEDLTEQAHVVDYDQLTATGAQKVPKGR